ncbi:MAG: hypothetical protein FJX75_21720 [Armatimonadetes bacterium]|nr:hypothetical protein [Armatimonadota bacterium]
MTRRLLFIVPAALLLALGLVCTQGWSATDDDTASVSLTLDEYVEVIAADVTDFGQGHTSIGLPGPGDGEDPLFSGGATTDKWTPTGLTRGYCNGAVGRSQTTIRTNTACTISLIPESVVLSLVGGSATLPARCQLGKFNGSKWSITMSWVVPWNGTGENTNYWLYALVGRQGLNDVNGTYSGTVTLEATTE